MLFQGPLLAHAKDPLQVRIFPEKNHFARSCIEQKNQKITAALNDLNINLMLESATFDKTTGVALSSLELSTVKSYIQRSDSTAIVQWKPLRLKLRTGAEFKNIFGAEDDSILQISNPIQHMLDFDFYIDYLKTNRSRSGFPMQKALQLTLFSSLNVTGYALNSTNAKVKEIANAFDLSAIHNRNYVAYAGNPKNLSYDKFIGLFEQDLAAFAYMSTDLIQTYENTHKDLAQKVTPFLLKAQILRQDKKRNKKITTNYAKAIVYRNALMIDTLNYIYENKNISKIDLIVGSDHVPGMQELVAAGFAKKNGFQQIKLSIQAPCQ